MDTGGLGARNRYFRLTDSDKRVSFCLCSCIIYHPLCRLVYYLISNRGFFYKEISNRGLYVPVGITVFGTTLRLLRRQGLCLRQVLLFYQIKGFHVYVTMCNQNNNNFPYKDIRKECSFNYPGRIFLPGNPCKIDSFYPITIVHHKFFLGCIL